MTTRIFKLKTQASPADAQWARKLAAHLIDQGFEGGELDDLVYEVAESLARDLKTELGATMGKNPASREYTAAEEINQHSLEDQLLVIGQWHAGSDKLMQALKAALGIDLPNEFWPAGA